MGTTLSKDDIENRKKKKIPSIRSQRSYKGKSSTSLLLTEGINNTTTSIKNHHKHSTHPDLTTLSSFSATFPMRRSSLLRKSNITANDNISITSSSNCFDDEEPTTENHETLYSPRTSFASEELDDKKKKKKLLSSTSDIIFESRNINKNGFWRQPLKPFIAYNKNDEKEYERQLRQHYVLKHIFRGNIHVPVSRDHPIIILDSACGAGFWTLDMALEYPNAKVIGLDAFPERNGSSNQPICAPNVIYKHGDLTSQIQLPSDSVDIIYQRDTTTILPHHSWPFLLSELKRVAKPGAYIQLVEYNFNLSDPGPVLSLVNEWYKIASDSVGVSPSEVKQLKNFLVKAGFQDVKERTINIPIGEWHEDEIQKENGFLYKQVIRVLFKSMKTWWISELDVSEEEYDKVVCAALDEFDDQQSSIEWIIYTARNPL
ncbi:hypothetical protein G6F62_010620 [Rhizopus arrhizus]|nr:hypothetical protein G6F23_000224 [Rhizopus arrhizus]KAG0778987.1 hypothetical protein G6F22_010901 [Rhizopus arrhizus]KAG0785557.1 hypothetical protein G6F21_009176 [Rhizopus arrhizus]KAG0808368.1 hypothetical protein G6F20_009639 [Rhizopus arrhizus]KAG0825634.1 hypothetical protein G6F19_009717 [Rhizopus arrhizus]